MYSKSDFTTFSSLDCCPILCTQRQHKKPWGARPQDGQNLARFFWADWFFLVCTGIVIDEARKWCHKGYSGVSDEAQKFGRGEFPRCSRQGTKVTNITNHRKSLKFGFGNISFPFWIPTSLSFGAPLLETPRSTIGTCPSKNSIFFCFNPFMIWHEGTKNQQVKGKVLNLDL